MATKTTDETTNEQAAALRRAEEAAAEAAAANKAREEAAKLAPEKAPYTVAAGLSVSCRRGIVDAGQPLTELDFEHGKRDLDDLVARGAVVKRA